MSEQPAHSPIPLCHTPGCDNDSKTRGLCGTCYATAAKAVNDGRCTWEYLEGLVPPLATPTKKKSKRPGSLFGVALKQAIDANPPQVIQDASAESPPDPIIPGPEAAHAASDGPQAPVAEPVELVVPTNPIGPNCPPMVSPTMADFQDKVALERQEREDTRQRMAERQAPPADPVIEPNTNADGTPRRMTQPEDLPTPIGPLPWETQ